MAKSTWVRWYYCDHGHPGWAELEIPEGYDAKEYICERDFVPTWSERYDPCRIKVEPIAKPSRETLNKLIKTMEQRIAGAESELKRYRKMRQASKS